MAAAHRLHDISDQFWERLRPLLPGDGFKRGRPARDNRLFLNAVFWILRTGARPYQVRGRLWRDRPPDYGDWKNTPSIHCGFCRWKDGGIWKRLLDSVIDDPDFEWLMIDASYIKVHPHGTGARGRQPSHRTYKRGLNSKLHLAVDSHGMPVRLSLSEGTVADCTQVH